MSDGWTPAEMERQRQRAVARLSRPLEMYVPGERLIVRELRPWDPYAQARVGAPLVPPMPEEILVEVELLGQPAAGLLYVRTSGGRDTRLIDEVQVVERLRVRGALRVAI